MDTMESSVSTNCRSSAMEEGSGYDNSGEGDENLCVSTLEDFESIRLAPTEENPVFFLADEEIDNFRATNMDISNTNNNNIVHNGNTFGENAGQTELNFTEDFELQRRDSIFHSNDSNELSQYSEDGSSELESSDRRISEDEIDGYERASENKLSSSKEEDEISTPENERKNMGEDDGNQFTEEEMSKFNNFMKANQTRITKINIWERSKISTSGEEEAESTNNDNNNSNNSNDSFGEEVDELRRSGYPQDDVIAFTSAIKQYMNDRNTTTPPLQSITTPSFISTPPRSGETEQKPQNTLPPTRFKVEIPRLTSLTGSNIMTQRHIIKTEENKLPLYTQVYSSVDSHPRNWNEEYEEILAIENENEKNNKLRDLARDFVHTAKKFGKIIISEYKLEEHQKTIKCNIAVGGKIGGLKYITQGIFFKFTIDTYGYYGGDRYSMKSGSHELKSLMRFRPEYDFKLPLMCIVDYRGYRLVCMSVLPLGERAYGCGNANSFGKVAFTEKAHHAMKAVADTLHLRAHLVGKPGVATRQVRMYGPVDIEVYFGLGSKSSSMYVIDFARLFPPTKPTGRKGSHLYYLFRPEFMSNYPIPLSSDTFSGGAIVLQMHDPLEKKYKEDVIAATEVLMSLCKSFAQKLSLTFSENQLTSQRIDQILQSMHLVGINFRFLGVVRSNIQPHKRDLKLLLFTEMVCRTIKNEILEKIRGLESFLYVSEEGIKGVICDYLNYSVLAKDLHRGNQFWLRELPALLRETYGGGNAAEEMFSEDDSSCHRHLHSINLSLLFERLEKILKINFTNSAKRSLKEDPLSFDMLYCDIKKVGARVTHTNIMLLAEAKVLTQQMKSSSSTSAACRLFFLAEQCYFKAISKTPDDHHILFDYSFLLFEFAILCIKTKGLECIRDEVAYAIFKDENLFSRNALIDGYFYFLDNDYFFNNINYNNNSSNNNNNNNDNVNNNNVNNINSGNVKLEEELGGGSINMASVAMNSESSNSSSEIYPISFMRNGARLMYKTKNYVAINRMALEVYDLLVTKIFQSPQSKRCVPEISQLTLFAIDCFHICKMSNFYTDHDDDYHSNIIILNSDHHHSSSTSVEKQNRSSSSSSYYHYDIHFDLNCRMADLFFHHSHQLHSSLLNHSFCRSSSLLGSNQPHPPLNPLLSSPRPPHIHPQSPVIPSGGNASPVQPHSGGGNLRRNLSNSPMGGAAHPPPHINNSGQYSQIVRHFLVQAGAIYRRALENGQINTIYKEWLLSLSDEELAQVARLMTRTTKHHCSNHLIFMNQNVNTIIHDDVSNINNSNNTNNDLKHSSNDNNNDDINDDCGDDHNRGPNKQLDTIDQSLCPYLSDHLISEISKHSLKIVNLDLSSSVQPVQGLVKQTNKDQIALLIEKHGASLRRISHCDPVLFDSIALHCSHLVHLTLMRATDRNLEILSSKKRIKFRALKYLNLSWSNIVDSTLMKLLDATSKHLEVLILDDCPRLNGSFFSKLPPSIRTVSLRNCSTIEADKFFPSLPSLPLLSEFNISKFHLPVNALEHLAKCSRLKRLNLEYCSVPSPEKLCSLFSKLHSLENLNANHLRHMNNEVCSYIALLSNLRELRMDSCRNIDDIGIRHLCNGNLPLRVLSLNHLNIGDNSAALISHKLPFLEKLSINYCDITERGFLALTDLSFLRVLNIKGNSNITELSLTAFFDSTRTTNSRIQKIHLNSCPKISRSNVVHLSSKHLIHLRY